MRRPPSGEAFSQVELLVSIAILAILATIAIPTMTGILPASRAGVAEANLAKLNGAVNTYHTAVGTFTNNTAAGVLAALQTRDPLVPGTPFFNASADVVVTSDTNRFRGVWDSGAVIFRFTPAGVSGSGVDLEKLAE